ncbi:MAG: alpha/beta hydrolase, partial [Cyanobacteria bacterium NC_groundwater_1444_Ag_S-0.65um_54_12]|nr:alpha/beta hydrolase [Cyanobacteria bacterium NC_groundwater_1444_Ag_S-0.65um_54_12]
AAALVAAATEPSIKGVVADCAFADFYHAFYPRIAKKKYPLPGAVATAIEKLLDLRLGIPAAQAVPLRHVAKLAGRPILIIHGDADTDTTPDNAQILFNACPLPKELWLVPGAAHAKSHAQASAQYERRVLDFWSHAFQAGE